MISYRPTASLQADELARAKIWRAAVESKKLRLFQDASSQPSCFHLPAALLTAGLPKLC